MYNQEFVLSQMDRIVGDLEILVRHLAPTDCVLYVDENGERDTVSFDEGIRIFDRMENFCASQMIGKTDLILIYDTRFVLEIGGEEYLPANYLVMRSEDGLQPLNAEDYTTVIPELQNRMATLVCEPYEFEAYRL